MFKVLVGKTIPQLGDSNSGPYTGRASSLKAWLPFPMHPVFSYYRICYQTFLSLADYRALFIFFCSYMNRKSMHGCKLDVSSSIAYTGKGSRVGPPPPPGNMWLKIVYIVFLLNFAAFVGQICTTCSGFCVKYVRQYRYLLFLCL